MRYDAAQSRVTENRPIQGNGVPLMSFGEDQNGEVYLMGNTPHGRGIFRISPVTTGGE